MSTINYQIFSTIVILFTLAGAGILAACLIKRQLYPSVWGAYFMAPPIVCIVLLPPYTGGLLALAVVCCLSACCCAEFSRALGMSRRGLWESILFGLCAVSAAYFQQLVGVIIVFVTYFYYIGIQWLWASGYRQSLHALIVASYPGFFIAHFALLAFAQDGYFHGPD